MAGPSLILFLGGMGGSPVEEMVAACRHAIARDTIERAQGSFQPIILVTDREAMGHGLVPSVMVESSQGPFHFGTRLREVIERHDIEQPFYVGGGSIPLLSAPELGAVAQQLSRATDTVITNNPYSADIVAFTPGKAIDAIDLPATDNLLAQLLAHQAGLRQVLLPRTAAYQFDVDTPTDVLVLKLHPGLGRHARAYVDSLDLDTSRLEVAMSYFGDEDAEVLVAGRVGSHVWSQLEGGTACRVRVLAEERGMQADRRSQVRSILGFYLERVGLHRFFDTLGELGHAAFIDSRVIFSHLGLRPSRSDRFYSDLGQPEKIAHPFVRQFTEAAVEAPIPVILGAHSLVSGGLLALIEIAVVDRGGGVR